MSPNVIRIVGVIVALNKAHGTYLGLDDLRNCYSLLRGKYGYNLSTRSDGPSLVLALPDSHKGVDADAIVITGFLESDPINKPIPRRASSPDWHISIMFDFYVADH